VPRTTTTGRPGLPSADAYSDIGLVPVMLAENGVRKHDGRKRLNRIGRRTDTYRPAYTDRTRVARVWLPSGSAHY
jgi:hypothetical protein